MIEIKEIVVNLLDSVEELALVAKTYPNDWTQFPTAIYKTSDKPYSRDTSGPENMTEHTIYIELYGKASLTSIENTLNNKFREIGFTRIIRSDGEDPATGLIRTSIQYKGIVDNRNGLVTTHNRKDDENMTQPTGLLSKGTTLSVKTKEGGTFVVLEGLQSTPEMGGDPEKVDVTTLADSMKRYIPGIKDAGDLAFKFLYDNSNENTAYRKLVALEKSGEIAEFKVTYPDNTAHTFNAGVNVKIASAEVNGALTFTANLTVNTEITVTNA